MISALASASTRSSSSGVTARIDAERRDRIRRNHTATHILHWALREVLGPHVKQSGSLVAPDRLRFDFSHDRAVTPEELDRVEALANAEIITDAPVRHYETTKEHAESLGAIAFFGEKYGDLVRVLEAGERSLELCAGTHVHALGFIGPVKIVSESSIGANLRRIEAVTGDAALAHIQEEEHTLRAAAEALRVKPEEVPARVERLRDEVKALQAELAAQRSRDDAAAATTLAAGAVDGVVVERLDGRGTDELRQLAIATRDAIGSGIVGLLGASPDGASASVVVAVSRDLVERGIVASDIAGPAATALGGGTGKAADLAVGGGKQAGALDEARNVLVRRAKEALGTAAV
jgi:alanyl-tRNA synthetase